jgi:hypothetical protein
LAGAWRFVKCRDPPPGNKPHFQCFQAASRLILLNDLIREKRQEEEYKPPRRTKEHEGPYFSGFAFLRTPFRPAIRPGGKILKNAF